MEYGNEETKWYNKTEKREIEFSSSVKYVQKIDNGKFVDLPFDLTRTFFFCVPHRRLFAFVCGNVWGDECGAAGIDWIALQFAFNSQLEASRKNAPLFALLFCDN